MSILLLIFIVPNILLGSSDSQFVLDGTQLSIIWVVPFIGILLSIAVFPLVLPRFWHQHFGKISLFWAVLFIFPFLFKKGWEITLFELLHVGLLEYLPFITLLLALFTISGGVRLTGSLVGTPMLNTLIILIGTVLASWIGTTGAAMLLIRPLIRANMWRQKKVHIIIFFIFLVANIGGSLTPLGDPPLFLGFLKGVDFFWTTTAMFKPMLFLIFFLLAIFFGLDTYYFNREIKPAIENNNTEKLGVEGAFNLLLFLGVISCVLLSGFWKPTMVINDSIVAYGFNVFHVKVEIQNLVRDSLLLGLTYVSWAMTSKTIREANEYTWFPIIEVAKLFAGIFVTIIPAIAILKAGVQGALSPLIESVSSNGEPVNTMYFWLTGILSSFLDNAPTYLVFFNTAGGDAGILMTEQYNTLLAISAGAVFMGANTYIGNAPNFMVKSIAESSGVQMPSFFGFLVKWSLPILFPLFILVSIIFF